MPLNLGLGGQCTLGKKIGPRSRNGCLCENAKLLLHEKRVRIVNHLASHIISRTETLTVSGLLLVLVLKTAFSSAIRVWGDESMSELYREHSATGQVRIAAENPLAQKPRTDFG